MLCICDTVTGDAVGIYRARHREAALDALAAKGRAPYGSTYHGHVWYGVAQNAGRLTAAGKPNHYGPHVDACSPYSRTTEAATLLGFAPGALADVLTHAARTSTTH